MEETLALTRRHTLIPALENSGAQSRALREHNGTNPGACM